MPDEAAFDTLARTVQTRFDAALAAGDGLFDGLRPSAGVPHPLLPPRPQETS